MSFGRSRATGGIAGAQGYQGNQGGAGVAGPQGNQGNQGNAGGTGPQGNQGFQGNQGNQGFQGVGGSPPFSDAAAILFDNDTPTKLLRFELVGLPAGTTIITPANVNITLPGINIANTWALNQTFTSKILLSAGTAAAPSLASSADPADGIYFPGPGEVGLSANGVLKLAITPDGAMVGDVLSWYNAVGSWITAPADGASNALAFHTDSSLRLTISETGVATFAGPVQFSGTSNSGLKVNNLTTGQRTGLTGANGMMVYDTDLSDFYGFKGGVWAAFGSGGGSSPPFSDAGAIVMDNDLGTKLLRFELGGWAGAATRVITPPDADITLAGINIAQSFSALQSYTAGLQLNGTRNIAFSNSGTPFARFGQDGGFFFRAEPSGPTSIYFYGEWVSNLDYSALLFQIGGGPGGSYEFKSTKQGSQTLRDIKFTYDTTVALTIGAGGVTNVLAAEIERFRIIGAALTWASTINIDFNSNSYRTVAVTGNTIFATQNPAANRQVAVRLTADGTLRTLTFPGTWIWLTPVPASLAASTSGVLSLRAESTTDASVYASWAIATTGDYTLGTNVRMKGGNIQIKNPETGLWNSLTNTGAATAEVTGYDTGEA